ncbi:MAG: QsdR family transcriptional regulator [Proteobacteria bacterium]|nr:QsdR family transcriptional regulator [Pseudomonadota bacterium]
MTQRRATPLSRILDGDAVPTRVTPMDAFRLARKKWLAGERLDIGKLAVDLGVGRATVFRWVGSREHLYGEIISSGFAIDLERAKAEARAPGIERLFEVIERLLRALVASGPLRRFVEQDPEFALRVLTSKHSPVQHRCMLAFREAIDAQVAAGAMEPALPPEELAYLLVRIVESFLYRDVITGADPDVATAVAAIRILCLARPETTAGRRE